MAKRKTKFDGDDLAKDLEDNLDQWTSVPQDEQNQLRSQIKAKERRISLRIASDVLEKVRVRAGREGLPYKPTSTVCSSRSPTRPTPWKN